MSFIGRKKELAILNRFLNKQTASLLVVKGRRRIGKSRLIEEFATPFSYYAFSGLPPTEHTTAQSQRNEFANQLSQQGFPALQANDWNDLFWLLAEKTQQGRVVILLDEISWMGSKDPDFLGKLKNAWDMRFKKNNSLILILCGSASSWIEKNILASTGFVGRISQILTLEELPLNDCDHFWGKQGHHLSAMEKLKILSVTGGIPRYLEEVNPKLSAEENIKQLCFTKGALLHNEFEHLFSSTFLRNSTLYRKIVSLLVSGKQELHEICKALDTGYSGRVSEYLEELTLAGFIQRDYTWQLKTGLDAKLSQFRLSDNYIRFYLKYIEKYHAKINRKHFDSQSLTTLPGFEAMMGLQFENLVLNNRPFIWHSLHLNEEDILCENPFFQHKTTKYPGCQIDYMIQTKQGTLYLCEIKFSKHPISTKIISEIDEKISRLQRPKGLSVRPVLITVNSVNDLVIESQFFTEIVDFSKVLN